MADDREAVEAVARALWSTLPTLDMGAWEDAPAEERSNAREVATVAVAALTSFGYLPPAEVAELRAANANLLCNSTVLADEVVHAAARLLEVEAQLARARHNAKSWREAADLSGETVLVMEARLSAYERLETAATDLLRTLNRLSISLPRQGGKTEIHDAYWALSRALDALPAQTKEVPDGE